MPRRALLLINRFSRTGEEQYDAAADRLRELGLDLIEAQPTKAKGWSAVVRSHRGAVDLVIVGGGDGSLNAAVDGVVDLGVPLGVLPLGTANDLARTLGLPLDLDGACRVIADGHVRQIDLGWVNGKHFLNAASLGLSVQISQELTREAKSRWGVFAYASTATRALWQARPFHAVIRAGDEVHRVKTVQIVVGNGVYFGGGTKVAADAAIDDQRLDLYSVEVKRWWQVVPLLPALRAGNYENRSFVRALRGEEFEVHTHRPRPVNTDGEITTRTPARFRVLPRLLPVYAPPPPSA